MQQFIAFLKIMKSFRVDTVNVKDNIIALKLVSFNFYYEIKNTDIPDMTCDLNKLLLHLNRKIQDQKKIKILRKDNENSLAKKILKLEHQLYPRAIVKFLSSR